MSDLEALAAAIRKGAALRPQAKGRYFASVDAAGTVGSCALGAAYEGTTGSINHRLVLSEFEAIFGHRLCYRETDYPNDIPQQSDYLTNVVTTLNDDYNWSRETIADFIAGLAAPASREA